MFNHLPFTRRRSIRRPGYDYAQPGAYFVTICAFHNWCIFGDVVCDEVQLNAFGEIAREEWFRGAQIRQYLQLLSDEYVVMPNHIHGIIRIVDHATPCCGGSVSERFGKPVPGSVPTIVRAFKSVTTRRINELRRTSKAAVWQDNYYEHVIRDEESLDRIRAYIAQNPRRWALDPENPRSVHGTKHGRGTALPCPSQTRRRHM